MSDIERRIEALERDNRRWRYAAGVLGSVLLITWTCAASLQDKVPELLQARRIQVLDPDGKPVIVLRADDHASALVLSYGQNHERVISLAAHKDDVGLMLMKNKEAPLLSARVDDAGSYLALFDGRQPSQKPRGIVLTSTSSAENPSTSPTVNRRRFGTSINLMQGSRQDDVKAGLSMRDPSGDVSLLLSGSRGKAVSLRVNQVDGKVQFLDETNKPVWSTP